MNHERAIHGQMSALHQARGQAASDDLLEHRPKDARLPKAPVAVLGKRGVVGDLLVGRPMPARRVGSHGSNWLRAPGSRKMATFTACFVRLPANRGVWMRHYVAWVARVKAVADLHSKTLQRRISNYCAWRLAQWRLRAVLIWTRLRTLLGNVAIGLFAVSAAALVLYVPALRSTLNHFNPLEAILAQLGATFGTILALVLTLSIIPIQRAGEVWSPAIVRLYRRDVATKTVFVVLGVLCVASFLLAVRGLAAIPVSVAFAAAIATLGISLDLLRWYHGHVCQLLEPNQAVDLAADQARRTIDRMQTLISRGAVLQHRSLDPVERGKLSPEDLEPILYQQLSNHPSAIVFWTNALAEIGGKAVARGETLLAASAVHAITQVTKHYLSARKRNLILVPSADALFLASESDVSVFTGPAYEALQGISRKAVDHVDQSIALRVSDAFQALAIHTANLGARAFQKHQAPLTYAPLSYLLNSVKYAQSKALDEVPFQSAQILASVVPSSPANIETPDICIPVIDGMSDIAMYFYTKHNAALAEHILGHIPTVLGHLLSRRDFYFVAVLRHSLEKLESLAPFAIVSEALAGPLNLSRALGKVYQPLADLFTNATTILVEVNGERPWVNPYNAVVDIAGVYSDHLRRLGEQNEFGNGFLLWEINYLIKHIASTIAYRIIDHPVRPGHDDEREVIDKLGWILSFCWVAFSKKKSISQQRADELGETLAYVGILFYVRNHADVLQSCVAHIRSILESYCEIASPPDDYAIGDLMTHLWALRLLTAHRSDVTITAVIDGALTKRPQALSEPQWQTAQEAIGRRRLQFEDRIFDLNRRFDQDSPEGLLHTLLPSGGRD